MTEPIPDDQTVWAGRRPAAELPSGAIRLAGVPTPMSVAVANSVSLIVRKPTANTDQAHLTDMLAADGQIIPG
jgi:hypothetical protein